MMPLRYQVLVACVGCALILLWWVVTRIEVQALNWFVFSGLFLVVCVLGDIFRLHPSSYHSYTSLMRHYIKLKKNLIVGYLAIRCFRKVCQNIEYSQATTLRKLLKNAAKSAFAKDHGLSTVRSIEEFRRKIPLSSYDDYLPYIKRVLDGELYNITFCAKIDFIAATSGTTSNRGKWYPKSLKLSARNELHSLVLLNWFVYDIPGLEYLRLMSFAGSPVKVRVDENGIARGSISAAYDLRSDSHWATPKIASEITNDEHAAYVDLLFGLRDREINGINGMTAINLSRQFKVLEKYWRNLCNDIEIGTLYSGIPLSDRVRYKLERLMRSDPARAAELRREFSKGFHGIVPRIWPHCKLVLGISTGTFQVYADILKQNYLGDIPLFSNTHIATEGIMGINLWPELSDVHYAPTAGLHFFEWVAVDDVTAEPVLLHEVELGLEYEMIITTYDGLYRYRTGDVVEFTKYYYQLPVYKFVRRIGDVLSCIMEKMPLTVVSSALATVVTKFKDVTLLDYTCTESVYYEKVSGTTKGGLYYVIFVEIEGDVTCLGEIAKQLDDELCSRDPGYQVYRNHRAIDTVTLIPLQAGAFMRFKVKRMTSNPNTSSMQYKVPRIIRNDESLQFCIDETLFD